MQGIHACLAAQGEGKVRRSVNVLCVSKQANPDAHLSHYSTSASGRRTPVRPGSVHLALFDSAFNDRLTKDLQMRAGVNFAKVGFDCVCSAECACIIRFSFQLGY